MLKIATLIATLVAAGAFASHAEAHGRGNFYASSFFRNQGRPHHLSPCEIEKRRRFEALQMAQQRRLAQMRGAQAAGARRARLAAAQQNSAVAPAVKQSAPAGQTSGVAVAKKSDLQPAGNTTAATKTAVADTVSTTKTASAAQVCRKYSAAADGLIDVPCE